MVVARFVKIDAVFIPTRFKLPNLKSEHPVLCIFMYKYRTITYCRLEFKRCDVSLESREIYEKYGEYRFCPGPYGNKRINTTESFRKKKPARITGQSPFRESLSRCTINSIKLGFSLRR